MFVYVAESVIPQDSSSIVGVFSDKEAAIKACHDDGEEGFLGTYYTVTRILINTKRRPFGEPESQEVVWES